MRTTLGNQAQCDEYVPSDTPVEFMVPIAGDVSPDGPEHDRVHYVARPFDDVAVGALVAQVLFKWRMTWDMGKEPW